MSTSNLFMPQWPIASINAEFTHKASEACYVGDLLWFDSGSNTLRSAAVYTDAGQQNATWQGFAQVFAGVSNSQQLSTDTTARNCRALIDLIYEFPCNSNTFNPGDYVAPAYSSGLNSQKLDKTTDPSLAIGRVVKQYTTATTKVKCRLTATALMGRYALLGTSQTFANVQANFRNAIDGGDFFVNPWQRGTTFSAISNTLTYTADRFFAVGGASSSISVSQQSQTDVIGTSNSLRWGRGAGTNTATINLGQVLESADCVRFQGRQVTLSFTAKAGAQFSAANSALTVQLNHSTTAGNDTAAHLVAASNNWQATPTIINTTQVLTTTATRYSFTGTVPANATQLGLLFSYAPTGTNNSTDTVDFYNIQLEDGPVATPFEHRDVQVELEICQRYCYQLGEPASGISMGQGQCTTTTVATILMPLPVQMRTAPTVTVTKGTIGVTQANGTNQALTTLAAGTGHTVNQIQLTATASAANLVAGNATLLNGNGGTGLVTANADF